MEEAKEYAHLTVGSFQKAEPRVAYDKPGDLVPLIIEIMEMNA